VADVTTRDVSSAESSSDPEPHALPFGSLGALGHVAFETHDLARLAAYYTDVIGLTAVSTTADAVHLSTGTGGHALELRQGERDGLTQIGFALSDDLELADVKALLRNAGVQAEHRSDPSPGIAELLELDDPDGNHLQLYHAGAQAGAGYSGRGIQPHKLGHICIRASDVPALCGWYERILGFRWSDWIGDFFVFVRLGPDHHSLNILAGGQGPNHCHHVAYELRDFSHVQEACDHLARNEIQLVWGPGRHGPGHNIFTYHRDPDGTLVELFCQLDVMNERLGVFDPRPWHHDNPQKPKRWIPDPLAPNAWGIGPPENFM
jgi:catechol-2,3-dioxygenase